METILHDFSDIGWEKSFVIACENERIVGVLGLDIDEEREEAEIWGPVITVEKWHEVAVDM